MCIDVWIDMGQKTLAVTWQMRQFVPGHQLDELQFAVLRITVPPSKSERDSVVWNS
jgi:hypothetical protein